LQIFQDASVVERIPDHHIADLRSEAWSGVGQGEDMDSPVWAAGAMEPAHVSGAVRGFEDVEQRAVDDRVVGLVKLQQ
jgi:hypothetical protein